MDIQASKLELLKTILEEENADLIQKVSDFIKKEQEDFWNNLDPEEQEEIRKGIEELDQGKRVSFEEHFLHYRDIFLSSTPKLKKCRKTDQGIGCNGRC